MKYNFTKKACSRAMAFALAASLTAYCGIAAYASESEAAPAAETKIAMDFAVVDVEGGQLRGALQDGIYSFKGVQYAQAGRFEMPQKVEAWEGVKNCFDYAAKCPTAEENTVGVAQFFIGDQPGPTVANEICQYLNIFSPDINAQEKKPVMVNFHGGAYSSGSAGGFGFDTMAKYGDVVTVSVGHRLNALGFMDVSEYGEEYKYSGNCGMADIVASLEWIKENISEFGGDPENVTIFGQSGGGGKVLTLMGLPAAEGLFQKAIVETGYGWTNSQEDARKLTKAVMDELQFTTIDELKAVEYNTLEKTTAKVMKDLSEKGEIQMTTWQPVVDGDYYPEQAASVEGFVERAKDIPLIIGTCLGENNSNGVGLVNNFGPGFCLEEYTDEMVLEKLTERYGDRAQAIMDEFQAAYPGHPAAEVLFYFVRAWMPEQEGGIFTASHLLAMAKANQGGAPVYNYIFAYSWPVLGGIVATHGAELNFVFHTVGLNKRLTNDDPAAYELQDRVCTAWTNFAKTGDPGQEGLEWPAFTAENGSTMIFDRESSVKDFPDRKLTELMTGIAAE